MLSPLLVHLQDAQLRAIATDQHVYILDHLSDAYDPKGTFLVERYDSFVSTMQPSFTRTDQPLSVYPYPIYLHLYLESTVEFFVELPALANRQMKTVQLLQDDM